jgi:ABC-type sugar transport system permease subunit
MMPRFLRGVFAVLLFLPFFSGDFVLGTGFLAVLAGTALVPAERYEAARVEGIKNRVQEFARITLPAITPHLLFAAVMQLAEAAAKLSLTQTQRYSDIFEIGTASAASLCIFIPVLAVYFALRRIGRCE